MTALNPHIGKLGPLDGKELSIQLQRLDSLARVLRFGRNISDLELAQYARSSLEASPAVFGAAIDGDLVGVAEITSVAPGNTAEMAFVVDAAWRRRGIGCRLLLAALAWAGERGLTVIRLQCTRSNWAVRQIAQKAEARLSLSGSAFFAEFDVHGAWRIRAFGFHMESDMSELSAAETAFCVVLNCLLLAGFMVWACYDAEEPPRPGRTRNLPMRRWPPGWKR
jgi:RimJ/RimL family protein N-acetyltransferase